MARVRNNWSPIEVRVYARVFFTNLNGNDHTMIRKASNDPLYSAPNAMSMILGPNEMSNIVNKLLVNSIYRKERWENCTIVSMFSCE